MTDGIYDLPAEMLSALPTIGQVLSIGQPNADTVDRSAKITPGDGGRREAGAGKTTSR